MVSHHGMTLPSQLGAELVLLKLSETVLEAQLLRQELLLHNSSTSI
jgi:hypothetical protein